MDELTHDRIEELEATLRKRREELRVHLDLTREGTRPVDLDEPIGRLTRIDAIQQQEMTAANRRDSEVRLQ